MQRCWWTNGDPLYEAYHDRVWGKPARDGRKLFEMLSLELFQSGLSWITILRKQEHFASAFAGWDIARIADFGEDDFNRLMNDAGIVRNRLKIEAVINNARRAPDLVAEFGGLAEYFWRFEPENRPIPPGGYDRDTLPNMIEEAKQMSKDLKKRGFKFTGPMVCMSFMQAVGIINDHINGCDLCPY